MKIDQYSVEIHATSEGFLMENLHRAIKEDMNAALEAFRNDSFDLVNIYANRIMSNAVFGSDTKVFLPGFFLKDVGWTFSVLKSREKPAAYSTAKSHGFKFIESLKESLSPLDEEELWREFQSFNDVIRKFEMSDSEEGSYSGNPEFTKNAFVWLLGFLKDNTNVLFDSRNLLFKGILNEMNRIFRVHSGGVAETVLMSLVKALDRYYDYFRRANEKPNKRIDEEKVKNEILPYVDRIEAVYMNPSGLNLRDADAILWDLVKGWRCFFIQWMELPSVRLVPEKGIALPPELKKKLSESITRTLEKEI